MELVITHVLDLFDYEDQPEEYLRVVEHEYQHKKSLEIQLWVCFNRHVVHHTHQKVSPESEDPIYVPGLFWA